MKRTLTRISSTFVLCCAVSGGHYAGRTAAQQGAEAPLTNSSVIKLVRAGFKEKTVIAIIRTRPARFDLSPDKLIELKRGGVGENVILAMLARDDAAFAAGDDFGDDDAFFNGGAGASRGARPTAPPQRDGEINIFGSSEGSRDRSRTRTTNGASANEGETTGSATVRILRPPAEAGGAAKLERTPTLTNGSIIELVEAGFSEGTIIRRIENSPVEFDLSPSKLAELRRRRVTDKVIAAMTAAMADDSPAQAAAPNNPPPNTAP